MAAKRKQSAKKSTDLVSVGAVQKRIYLIRDTQAMLDSDLAELWRRDRGIDSSGAAKQRAVPCGFHVSAQPGGVDGIEKPNWHLKRGTRREAVSTPRVQRAGSSDALQRPEKQARGRCERRDHARVCRAPSDSAFHAELAKRVDELERAVGAELGTQGAEVE